MLVPLKAKRSFPYAGRDLRAGQDFDAESKSDAHLLVTIGHASYATRQMVAARPVIEFSVEGAKKLMKIQRRGRRKA